MKMPKLFPRYLLYTLVGMLCGLAILTLLGYLANLYPVATYTGILVGALVIMAYVYATIDEL